MEDEDFWNKSNIQSFSFDEDDKVRYCLKISNNTNNQSTKPISILFLQCGFVTKHDQKLFVDDNISEISYELPASTEVPLGLIIADNDLRIGMPYCALNSFCK